MYKDINILYTQSLCFFEDVNNHSTMLKSYVMRGTQIIEYQQFKYYFGSIIIAQMKNEKSSI